jgi:uncharacterized protein (TIGR02284 family)
MANDDVIDTLGRLIETCRDAERGFRAAADAVRDPALERLFSAYARQRAAFAQELEVEARRLGGAPPRRGSVAGALHRAFINLRAAISGRDEGAVIAEAERGEAAAVATYAAALRAVLPPEVGAVVARQAARVKEGHDRLRDLKRAA